ncbi:deoxynucleoside kinase [Mycoplasma crocodyli]|uniref:Deoxyguanosine kinase n=1 Tax=Mycoplasma crocodyli (strain ATCC 51981 / MP145) TaxID=512564 RepID=D5E5K9_MYCCM|nr:deoxynucleoside kinase [Mycoplasma crocodyli]ADE19802.1 deoxyguanosine kinase [Mycoplasma crocodyli MP145]
MLIGISGMISSGKSVLSKKLNKYYAKSVMLKEFEEDDEVFNTFLKWLYEKRPNLTIGFQSYVVENHTTKLSELLNDYKKNSKDWKHEHIFLDRFSIEHYIFAHVNLEAKGKKYLDGYDALFSKLITQDETPNLAIYLDMTFETFKKRLFSRGRSVEVNNFEANYEYFYKLYSVYKDLFIKQAAKYNLNYVIINTDDLNEQEVFKKAIEVIDKFVEKGSK